MSDRNADLPIFECDPNAQRVSTAGADTAGSNRRRQGHPLGPFGEYVYSRRPLRARLIALAVLAGSVTLLGVAATITPDEAGFGSHRQLGLAPCTMPALIGVPCPTCGMTTAFAHSVRGDLLTAFHTQPAGFMLAVLCMIAAIAAGWTVVTGRYIRVNWYRVRVGWVTFGAIGVILLAWGYKVAAGWLSGNLPY